MICAAFVPLNIALAEEKEQAGPDITAEAAVIYAGDTGEIIWSKNADQQMEPASITKLMTCLLAAERLDLDQEIEITKEATDVIPTNQDVSAGGGKDNSRGTALCGCFFSPPTMRPMPWL